MTPDLDDGACVTRTLKINSADDFVGVVQHVESVMRQGAYSVVSTPYLGPLVSRC
jgi:hypothetical protein